MTAVDLLKETRRLIDEIGWTQGAYARDDRGAFADVENPKAVCFCLSGAIRRARLNLRSFDLDTATAATLFIAEAGAGRSIPAWNDAPSRTKDAVLKTLDKAIELAGARHGTV